MSISGSLEDVSVADVMQFIHLGRRTGTLVLNREGRRAMVGFHRGKLVSARVPGLPKLGDLLVESGLLDRGTLEEAVAIQADETNHRSLGQILASQGAVQPERLRETIVRQIESAVSEVVTWDSGSFEFAVDNLKPVDDIALYPGDVVPDADINTQMVLLEAARIFDEKNREEREEPVTSVTPPLADGAPGFWNDTEPAGQPGETSMSGAGTERLGQVAAVHLLDVEAGENLALDLLDEAGVDFGSLWLDIVSHDDPFVRRLTNAVPDSAAHVRRLDLDAAHERVPRDAVEVIVMDLRRDASACRDLHALHRARHDAWIIALVEAGASLAEVYEAGALAALPADVEAVMACIENLLASRLSSVRRARRKREARTRGGGVERLRRVFGDLRSGLISATVALNLMHIISESVERAVLFLVKREEMVALGAFGLGSGGRSLAELTRGIHLSVGEENALTRALDDGEARSWKFREAGLPEEFTRLVGEPRTGQTVVFPVLGAQRVISVIYTDNGDRDEPIEDIDILELATAQVGMAFENELLRRQISQRP